MGRQGTWRLAYAMMVHAIFATLTLSVLTLTIDWMESVKALKEPTGLALLNFYAWRLPAIFQASLLPGAVLGIALTIYTMGRRHELIAWRAAGASLPQLLLPPLWVVGAGIVLVELCLVHIAIPNTRDQADDIAQKLGIADPGIQLFQKPRHWFATDRGFLRLGKTNQKSEVQDLFWVGVAQNNRPTEVIFAKRGHLKKSSTSDNVHVIEVKNAQRVMIKSERDAPATTLKCLHALDAIRVVEDPSVVASACEAPAYPSSLTGQKEETFELPIDIGVVDLIGLTGHPGGWNTPELVKLVQGASGKGQDISPYLDELRHRLIRPLWLLLSLLFAGLLCAGANPRTGIQTPLAITAAMMATVSFCLLLTDQWAGPTEIGPMPLILMTSILLGILLYVIRWRSRT